MWQPDGWGQTRIGVLTPHADVGPETELNALAPDGISIHAARIPFGSYRPGGTMVINPPWFSDEIDQKGADYFRSQGIEVVYSGPAGLPSDQQAIRPEAVFDWVRTHTPERAEAVFIGGNGFRAIGVINALEDALSRPVLTANQVAFWRALSLAKANVSIVNYGRIFEVAPPN
jgi:maleate cis-trans isomerase